MPLELGQVRWSHLPTASRTESGAMLDEDGCKTKTVVGRAQFPTLDLMPRLHEFDHPLSHRPVIRVNLINVVQASTRPTSGATIDAGSGTQAACVLNGVKLKSLNHFPPSPISFCGLSGSSFRRFRATFQMGLILEIKFFDESEFF